MGEVYTRGRGSGASLSAAAGRTHVLNARGAQVTSECMRFFACRDLDGSGRMVRVT